MDPAMTVRELKLHLQGTPESYQPLLQHMGGPPGAAPLPHSGADAAYLAQVNGHFK